MLRAEPAARGRNLHWTLSIFRPPLRYPKIMASVDSGDKAINPVTQRLLILSPSASRPNAFARQMKLKSHIAAQMPRIIVIPTNVISLLQIHRCSHTSLHHAVSSNNCQITNSPQKSEDPPLKDKAESIVSAQIIA
jgi:hypothetical protein